jgi:hypothetical protein
MRVAYIQSSIPELAHNQQKMVQIVGETPPVSNIDTHWLGHHQVNIVLDANDDGFAITIIPATIMAHQKAVIVTIVGCLQQYTNRSERINPTTEDLKPDPLYRREWHIKVYPGQKIYIGPVQNWEMADD